MSRIGVGTVLLGAAVTLVSQIGCVSPSGTERAAAAAAAAHAAERSELQATVTGLESEVALLTTQAAAYRDEAAAAQDQAAAARDAAAAARDEAAAAQDDAAAARDEATAARDQTAAAEMALSEAAAAAASAQEAAAQARTEAAQAQAASAQAAAEAARARTEAARAQAEADALRAAAPVPGIQVSPELLDLALLDLSSAQVAVAGPDTIYVSSIRYAGQLYSALLRYLGGTSATVERVFGPGHVTIPDSVDLSRTQLSLVAPDTLEVSNVEVAGRAYSGQLRHAGGDELEVAGIRQVTLPPAATEQLAGLREQFAAARAAAVAAEAAAETARALAVAAAAELAEARQAAAAARMAIPAAAVAVAAEALDAGLLSLAGARASLAGPDQVYVSGIEYAGRSYSALLKYHGGTSATVEQVYGSDGKLIPDSVGLERTEFAFVAPNVVDVAYVAVNGQGYSGRLRYAGGNRLEVVGIRRVTLPPTAAQQVAAAQAASAAAMADAQAAAAATAAAQASAAAAQAEAAQIRAELAVMMQDAEGRRIEPAMVDFSLLNLDAARVSVAGPESIYVSGIRYGGGEVAARLRYLGASRGVVDALFDTASGGLPALDLSAPAIEVRGPETMVISNVGIGGAAYSFTLAVDATGAIVISQQGQGHGVRSAAELLRDELLTAPGVTRVVSRISGGRALPGEGAWTVSAAGVASQTDPSSSHAKYAFEEVPQPAAPTLYGITVGAGGSQKVGYGLHFLASEPPRTGATWNYGRSYLMWATRERDFYGTEATQVQLYESLDGNRLMWLNSRNLRQGMTPGMTLEALYDPTDCGESMGMSGEPCYGSITVLVDGQEQFKAAVSAEVAGQEADAVALRALGGPVEFTGLYVHRRR